MKRVRITIEIDVHQDMRKVISAEAVKLASVASRHGRVVYVATELVTDVERNIIIDET